MRFIMGERTYEITMGRLNKAASSVAVPLATRTASAASMTFQAAGRVLKAASRGKPDRVPFAAAVDAPDDAGAWSMIRQLGTEIGRAHVCTPVPNDHLLC